MGMPIYANSGYRHVCEVKACKGGRISAMK